jgi:hypothetical protein
MKPSFSSQSIRPDRSGKPAWAAWYGTTRWKALRAAHLSAEPFCRMCAAAGVKTRAVVLDHIEPHRGDPRRFWGGPFQSLCKRHHDSEKQHAEKLGYGTELGPDGLPLDPRHPFNLK